MTPVDQFSAVADPTRCRVIELLNDRAMPVHELTAAFSISRPAISRHLRVLKDAGLVKELKQGRENVYSLQHSALAPMAQWLSRLSTLRTATHKQRRDRARTAAATPASTSRSSDTPKSLKPSAGKKPRSGSTARPTPAPQMQLDLF